MDELIKIEVTAICKTDACSFKDKPSVFISTVEATQCAECGQMMETTSKEVADGGTTEAE